jgi:two-component system, chemotaxis family, response regulator PixG
MTTSTIWPNMQNLIEQLQPCSEQQLTGRLHIWAGGVQHWYLFFCFGRLVWASGGIHPYRRWLRLMGQHCPQIQLDQRQQLNSIDVRDCDDYNYLIQLVKQQKITGQQASRVVRNNVIEVFFDILQQESFGPLSFDVVNENLLDPSLTLMRPIETLAQTFQSWIQWRSAGLSKLSPNMAPVIRDLKQLKSTLSESTHQHLINLADGHQTLRDISAVCQQDLLLLTRTLLFYVRRQLLELVAISDLSVAGDSIRRYRNFGSESNIGPMEDSNEGALVAHVDDCPRVGQQMRTIASEAGYRFLGIQDSVLALPTLLDYKPDLIFLDLMMPVVNGFELCAQIRKTSLLKDTPVIILTSNEGLFDWVRARFVGCTTYITKPVQSEKVIPMLQRYTRQASQVL